MNTCTASLHRTVAPGTRRQRGLTLVELMVAVVIGLILTAGVIQIFVGSNQTYRFQESMSRIQENGRYALETISRDLRSGDYRGCAGRSLEAADMTDLSGGGSFDFTRALEGYTMTGGTWSPAPDNDVLSQNPSGDGDILRIRSTAGGGAADVSHHQSSGSNLYVDDTSGFAQNETVIGTNCSSAVRFDIQNQTGGPPQLTVPGHPAFYENYEPDEVFSSRPRYYFLGAGVGGEPALFRLNHDGSVDELVEGIERIALQFGEDTNGDREIDVYRPADQVSDFESVVAVRVSLLLRGREDNVTDEPQTVSFPPGQSFTAGDQRLRQVFTATVSLRNRLQ